MATIETAVVAQDPGGNQESITSPKKKQKRGKNDNRNKILSEHDRLLQERLRSSWGIREVLLECGVRLNADTRTNPINSAASRCGNIYNGIQLHRLGCRMDSDVPHPSSLRASIEALLKEMRSSGIDEGNARVLESLESLITNDDDNEADNDNESENSPNNVLRRMLLPMYSTCNNADNDGNVDKDNDDNNFKQKEKSDDINISISDSSIIKVLLRIDLFQSMLLSSLLQKLPELVSLDDDNDDNENDRTKRPTTPRNNDAENDDIARLLPKLILTHIKWLDYILEPHSLLNTLLQILTICSTNRNLQLDILSTLPEITSCASIDGGDDNDDDLMEMTTNSLRELYADDPGLLVPCLDALGNMSLGKEGQEEVLKDALQAFHSASCWSLPAIAKFVMGAIPTSFAGGGGFGSGGLGATNTICQAVVSSLRLLQLTSGTDNDDDADGNALTLEALSQGMQYRANLSDALLNSIKKQPPPSAAASQQRSGNGAVLTKSDVWLLLCCAHAPHNRGKVQALVRKLAVKGGIGNYSGAGSGLGAGLTEAVLTNAIRGNGRMLACLWTSSLEMAESLVRNPEAAAQRLGGHWYQLLFTEFKQPIHRQEVIASLVTHIGSESNPEVDTAMIVLTNLSSSRLNNTDGTGCNGATALKPFAPFLTSLLDCIQSLTCVQIRRLFLLLFAVGEDNDDLDSPTNGGGGNCDDVHIVIRKFLCHDSPSLKRIGIIGAVSFAVSKSVSLESKFYQRQQSSHGQQKENGEDDVAFTKLAHQYTMDVTSILDLAHGNCMFQQQKQKQKPNNDHQSIMTAHDEEQLFSQGSALACFLDELCFAVQGQRLMSSVKEWILDRFSNDLEVAFMGEFADPMDLDNGTEQMMLMEDDEIVLGTEMPSHHGNSNNNEHADKNSFVNILDLRDRALADGSILRNLSQNPHALRGEMRFNVDGSDALIYVKIISLLSSNNALERMAMPQQLAPLLRLLSSCHDSRFGGRGLSEIDAVLGCPLFLPDTSLCGIEFTTSLSKRQQWTAVQTLHVATCWCRELLNCFVYSAAFPNVSNNEFRQTNANQRSSIESTITMTSATTATDELRTKLVMRLNHLVTLEEDLMFMARKCYHFYPPGMKALPVPKDLLKDNNNDENDDLEEEMIVNISNTTSQSNTVSATTTTEEKRQMTAAKKRIAKCIAAKTKAKAQLLKQRKLFELTLAKRAKSSLTPLNPDICLALGFPELSAMGGFGVEQGRSKKGDAIMSLGASQLRTLKVGSPVTNLLFKGVLTTLTRVLQKRATKKENPAFKRARGRPKPGNGGGAVVDRMGDDALEMGPQKAFDNPYALRTCKIDSGNHSVEENCNHDRDGRLSTLESFIQGGVFVAMHEHLAALAEIRGYNENDENGEDDDDNVHATECLRILLGCVRVIAGAEELPQKSIYIILRQLAEGSYDYEDANSTQKEKRLTERNMIPSCVKYLHDLFDLVEETLIASGGTRGGCSSSNNCGEEEGIDFIMEGVSCLESLLRCTLLIEGRIVVPCTTSNKSNADPNFATTLQPSQKSLRKKLSKLCHLLLQRQWPPGTKFNKSNIGTLVKFYIDHSYKPIELSLPCTNGNHKSIAQGKIPCEQQQPLPQQSLSVLQRMEPNEFGRMSALIQIGLHVLPELPNTAHCKGPVENYPSLTRQSFGCYFSTFMTFLPKELEFLMKSSLVQQTLTSKVTVKPSKSLFMDEQAEENCEQICEAQQHNQAAVSKVLELLSILTNLLGTIFDLFKENSDLIKRPYLLIQLRVGTLFMETFVFKVVPYLQCHFRTEIHEAVCISIIKNVQHRCTRHLVNVISHGKRTKDTNLAKETPRCKKVLESFIHKIRALMRKNQCLTALWGGNLKEKHINGSAYNVDSETRIDSDDSEEDDNNDQEVDEEEEQNSESENEYSICNESSNINNNSTGNQSDDWGDITESEEDESDNDDDE